MDEPGDRLELESPRNDPVAGWTKSGGPVVVAGRLLARRPWLWVGIHAPPTLLAALSAVFPILRWCFYGWFGLPLQIIGSFALLAAMAREMEGQPQGGVAAAYQDGLRRAPRGCLLVIVGGLAGLPVVVLLSAKQRPDLLVPAFSALALVSLPFAYAMPEAVVAGRGVGASILTSLRLARSRPKSLIPLALLSTMLVSTALLGPRPGVATEIEWESYTGGPAVVSWSATLGAWCTARS